MYFSHESSISQSGVCQPISFCQKLHENKEIGGGGGPSTALSLAPANVLRPFISTTVKSFPFVVRRSMTAKRRAEPNRTDYFSVSHVPSRTRRRATGDVCLGSGTGHQVSSITCVFNSIPRANHFPQLPQENMRRSRRSDD